MEISLSFYLTSNIAYISTPVNYCKRFTRTGDNTTPMTILQGVRELFIEITSGGDSDGAQTLLNKLLQSYVNLARCISNCSLPFSQGSGGATSPMHGGGGIMGGSESLFLFTFIEDTLSLTSSNPTLGYAILAMLLEELIGSTSSSSSSNPTLRIPVRWREEEVKASLSSTGPDTVSGSPGGQQQITKIEVYSRLVVMGLESGEGASIIDSCCRISTALLSLQNLPSFTKLTPLLKTGFCTTTLLSSLFSAIDALTTAGRYPKEAASLLSVITSIEETKCWPLRQGGEYVSFIAGEGIKVLGRFVEVVEKGGVVEETERFLPTLTEFLRILTSSHLLRLSTSSTLPATFTIPLFLSLLARLPGSDIEGLNGGYLVVWGHVCGFAEARYEEKLEDGSGDECEFLRLNGGGLADVIERGLRRCLYSEEGEGRLIREEGGVEFVDFGVVYGGGEEGDDD